MTERYDDYPCDPVAFMNPYNGSPIAVFASHVSAVVRDNDRTYVILDCGRQLWVGESVSEVATMLSASLRRQLRVAS